MESFASLFEQHLAGLEMREGEVVNAKVVAIDNKYVTVIAGLKSQSLIPTSEFKSDDGALEVAVGDMVQVAIDVIDDGCGETRLSREKAKRLEAWSELEDALVSGKVLTAPACGRVKGGLGVIHKNIRLFLPGSLLDVRAVRDFTPFERGMISFKVVKIDRARNNIVISRKAVEAESNSKEIEAIKERMAEGKTVVGTVKNITDYGVFVDLDGIDGLIYITDLCWKRVRHPSEAQVLIDGKLTPMAVGLRFPTKVLRFDHEKHRVSLGLKQLESDPWIGIEQRHEVGKRIFGTVSNITDYGAFVELQPGVEGLVHVSEMDWTNKNVSPSKLVQLGDQVEVQILELDTEKRRISLGLKQTQANPWVTFANKFKKGDRITRTIRSITDFGLFIDLDEGGIDGLVHISDLSWDKSGDEAIRQYKKQDQVEVMILSIDHEKERIALGIKHLSNDPYNEFYLNHDKGDIVKGVVQEVSSTEAIIELEQGVSAVLPVREAAHQDRVNDLTNLIKVGDEIEAIILNIDKKSGDRKSRSISLSLRALEAKEEAEAILKVKKAEKSSGSTNLGALLQDKFAK